MGGKAEMIIREYTQVASKSHIADIIHSDTGLSVGRMTVYKYQKKLGLL